MWNIGSSKSRRSRRAMSVVIILLYIATFVNFAMDLSLESSGFTSYGNIWIRYQRAVRDNDTIESIGLGIASVICNILADSVIIWRCWMLWRQRFLIVVLPTLCLVSGVVFKILDIRLVFMDETSPDKHSLIVYASSTLATTLWCTLLIIYRILSAGCVNGGPWGGLRAYRHVIEVLVESSAFYCVCLIVYTVLYASNSWGQNYIDAVAGIARGIAPTLLLGRVAAGHARPDDSSHGSIMSSLRFGQGQSQTSIQQDSLFSINFNDDPEAQVAVERPDEPDPGHVETSPRGHTTTM
ncbi:hypothetical protein EDD85DRAFT_234784 [Armillaria nabsnona]|nr:hypothetical protein EDD85DRAFT_234784 [Armillaria nabsnona]